MAKPRGTKRVVWASWSANVAGVCFSGRDQFSAEGYKNYISRVPSLHEKGLGHVASVIKGSLKKQGKIPKSSTVKLGHDQIKLWDPVAGPKEIPRGRAAKNRDATSPDVASKESRRKPAKKKDVVSPDQETLF